jgi:hypothetical protein
MRPNLPWREDAMRLPQSKLTAAGALLFLTPVVACGSDQEPAIAPTVAGPPVGGDEQPELKDVVRAGLTKEQAEKIFEACAGAQEITPDGACHESIPAPPAIPSPAPGTTLTPAPGRPADPCRVTAFCLIFDLSANMVVVVDADRADGDSDDDSKSDQVRLRLAAKDSVIAKLAGPASSPPAESSPTGESSTDPDASNEPSTDTPTDDETYVPDTPQPDAS